MVIIPVSREVSLHGSLFDATTLSCLMSSLIIVLVLSGANLCSMSVRVLLKQSESASMLSQCTPAQSIEEAISAENAAISILSSLRKVSFLHDKAGSEKPIGH